MRTIEYTAEDPSDSPSTISTSAPILRRLGKSPANSGIGGAELAGFDNPGSVTLQDTSPCSHVLLGAGAILRNKAVRTFGLAHTMSVLRTIRLYSLPVCNVYAHSLARALTPI